MLLHFHISFHFTDRVEDKKFIYLEVADFEILATQQNRILVTPDS